MASGAAGNVTVWSARVTRKAADESGPAKTAGGQCARRQAGQRLGHHAVETGGPVAQLAVVVAAPHPRDAAGGEGVRAVLAGGDRHVVRRARYAVRLDRDVAVLGLRATSGVASWPKTSEPQP